MHIQFLNGSVRSLMNQLITGPFLGFLYDYRFQLGYGSHLAAARPHLISMFLSVCFEQLQCTYLAETSKDTIRDVYKYGTYSRNNEKEGGNQSAGTDMRRCQQLKCTVYNVDYCGHVDNSEFQMMCYLLRSS